MKEIVATIKDFIVVLTPIILAWIAYKQIGLSKKQDTIHKEMNGMKSELVEAVRGEAGAKGELKGAADNQALTDAKEQNKK